MNDRREWVKNYRSTDKYKKNRKKYDKKYHSSDGWKKIKIQLDLDPKRKLKKQNYQRKYLAINNILNKKIIVRHYTKGSMTCMCDNCPENGYDFLSIEHILGRKNYNHPKKITTYSLYVWILENNFPEDIEILCFNCNFARNLYGLCPHERELQT